ncbi:MAG TPA: glycerophosphodiester phosphodiesterase family protein [Methylomirabilota bacterium]|nr:glycerophosphodiester phosphodiesterase family protein [Methylomirabilota bacterium]
MRGQGCLILLGALVMAASSAAGPAVQVAAHRGGALLWPENSLLAFRNAVGLGVELLETDVHLTADDQLIVLHDPTLDRTTTGRGPVRDARLAELAPLRLRGAGATPTDEPIPTLAQVLDLVASARGVGLLLEIKVDAVGRRYPGIEEKTLAMVRERGLLDRTPIMAFQPETVRRVRELEPAARTVLLVSRGRTERERANPPDAVRLAREAGAAWLGINHRLLDSDVIAAARRAGVSVAAWTVNQESDIRRVLDLGVDVVISDQPDLALRLAGRGPRKP